jgi:putative ABC transport system permease protein
LPAIDRIDSLALFFLLQTSTEQSQQTVANALIRPIIFFMISLLQDLRFGMRMLRKNPGFTLAAIITLMLGIGGNTAIFTITSALLLRPLPYQEPRQLVLLGTHRQGDSDSNGPNSFSLNRYELLRDRRGSFSDVAVFTNDSLNLTGRGEPQQVPVARASPNFFSLLGVSPQLGRAFADDEGQPAGKPVVMISDALWHDRFGGDQNVIGQSVTLDSAPYTVVGVLPAGIQFPFLAKAEIWSPRYFELTFTTPEHLRAGVGYLQAIARLKPGSSIKSAATEMEVFNQQYNREYPKAPDGGPAVSVVIGNLQELTVANVRTGLIMLSVMVGVVLLIACANVASLLLSRALARRKEIAVRTALGASQGAIIRQLLMESVLLALMGGVLGLGLSLAATRYLATYLATPSQTTLPLGFPILMDARVLLFTLAISILTGLVFGLFPALQLSKININQTLRDEGRGATGGHRRVQLKGLLVVAQVSLCLVLLICAGLLVRSFSKLLGVDPGFDPRNVLTMNISLPTVKYANPEQQIAFFDEMLRKVTSAPGVHRAAMSAALPLNPRRITPVLPEGQPEVPLAQRPFIIIEAISPSWFQTMGVPLKAGRDFTDADTGQSPKVVIMNEALARRYWPNENAVGKHIAVGRQTPAEIIGVAADVKNSGLAVDAQPQLYLPFRQLPWGNMNLLVRTSVEPHSMISALRGQIFSVDPDQPVTGVQTLDELLDGSRAQPRFTMLLLGIFSATALALAIVGIYGVLAYSVAQRRQELGIRLALGASKSDILGMVVRQGFILTLAGIAFGLIFALLASRYMDSLLYKVGPRDLTTFTLAPLTFLLIALAASYLPAWRATQVDPTEVMRHG